MDFGDYIFFLEMFNLWKLEVLKDFLSKRGLFIDGIKVELVVLCFVVNFMKLFMKVLDCEYVCQFQKEYNDLLYVDGFVLFDLFKIGVGWQDEMSGMFQWLLLFLFDIVNFFIDKGISNIVKMYMNDYKIGKVFEYCLVNFIKEIFFYFVFFIFLVCFVRVKCILSQRVMDENYMMWVVILKEFGCVKFVFCFCIVG